MKRLILLVTISALGVGCGYTKEEYQLQGDKLTRALAKQRSAETRVDEITAELEISKGRVADLEERMRALGLDLEVKDHRVGEMAATLAERERALAEYRARAAKIDETRARVQLLRAKLESLAASGVEVRVRRNRVAIVLPADLLFDKNKDKLKNEGKEALKTIAGVLKEDPVLATRDYQIAGHSEPDAKDGMGLSVSRARGVARFLVDPQAGGLDKNRFSAAGFGDADPVGANDSDEGKAKNRRVEIVLQPTASEMLDLRALANETAPRK